VRKSLKFGFDKGITDSVDTSKDRYHNGDTLVHLNQGLKMIKNFVKHGNSWAVIIDRPILDLLNIDPESQIELTTDGTSIRIAQVSKSDAKAKVRAARTKVNAKHSKAFKKLAE
jgi:antitoxin MazE